MFVRYMSADYLMNMASFSDIKEGREPPYGIPRPSYQPEPLTQCKDKCSRPDGRKHLSILVLGDWLCVAIRQKPTIIDVVIFWNLKLVACSGIPQ
ncbi:MAG: hypothetical protein MJZ28_06740 [Paludibacteraceae bacterium]|nr:hypothetical protein [Paludibacteraceae bacterium]